jgi:hypothetical protein
MSYFLLLSVAAAFSAHDVPRPHSERRIIEPRGIGGRTLLSQPSLFCKEGDLVDEKDPYQASVTEGTLGDTPVSFEEKPRAKRRRIRKRIQQLLRKRRSYARKDEGSRTEKNVNMLDDPTHIVTKRGSVFAEARTMLTLNDMIYAFVRLRAYANRHEDEALQRKLQVPQISSTLTPAITENIHLLKKGKKFESDFNERARQTVNKAEFDENATENSEVIYFGDSDDNCLNSCVYGIGVNRSEKRITVWFRGTVSDSNGLNHWEKNFDTTLRLEENPIDDMLESLPTFHLHRGFVRAMLGRKRKIMMRILQYKKEHPETADFPLFVSGHSLGGSIATLFGFYASLEPEFTKNGPVRIYTFAAPPVGDKDFGKVFRYLEEQGNVRLARIHNANDPIPSAFALTRYAHIGMGIELNFADYEIVDKDRSSVRKITKIFQGQGEHKLSRSYEYLNRHAIGFNKTLDEMYLNELGI